jgi:hypothetical protein
MRYVNSDDGSLLFTEAPEAIPMLKRLEEEVLSHPVFHKNITMWAADSLLPPPTYAPVVSNIPPLADNTYPLPITPEMAAWIILGHDLLNNNNHIITNETLSATFQYWLDNRPITDYGDLLDKLDWLGRPPIFNVVVHASILKLSE